MAALWILPLVAVNTVIGGLMLRWFGAEYAERVASACSVCRPGETPPVCQIPEFVTTAGTVMVLLGGAGVVVLALRRVTTARCTGGRGSGSRGRSPSARA